GNPERPEVMNQLSRAIDGIAAACRALDVPIVSGNVSLYNETSGRSILPTPTVAAVGIVARPEHVITAPFKRAGDAVLLLGRSVSGGARALGGSEWLTRTLAALGRGLAGVEAPAVDLALEARLQRLLLELARAGLLESAHDVSDGGMAAALAECCVCGASDADVDVGVGARVELGEPGERERDRTDPLAALAALFGEAASRVVVSARPTAVKDVLERAERAGVPAARIGQTGGDALTIVAPPFAPVSLPLAELRARREGCLRSIVGA
ncbi:MAG TPA: AIR synthase-related protein, partial [Polyangiaceae bacterium]|nr:AIR synthase-related protein [Polyangiaceae bacterium]